MQTSSPCNFPFFLFSLPIKRRSTLLQRGVDKRKEDEISQTPKISITLDVYQVPPYLTHRDASSRFARGNYRRRSIHRIYPRRQPWLRMILPAPTRLISSTYTFLHFHTSFPYISLMGKEERLDGMIPSNLRVQPVPGFLQMYTYHKHSPPLETLCNFEVYLPQPPPPFLNIIRPWQNSSFKFLPPLMNCIFAFGHIRANIKKHGEARGVDLHELTP